MQRVRAFYVPNGPNLLADIGNIGFRSEANERALKSVAKSLESEIEVAVVVSPHFVTNGGIAVVGESELKQIFDFYGFPEEFYNFSYNARGSPAVAGEIAERGSNAGLKIQTTTEWGLDHGAWTPLIYMLPSSKIPIIPISVERNGRPEDYETLGHVIREISMDHKLTLISTGSIIHRLDLFQRREVEVPGKAEEYLSGVISGVKAQNWENVWNIHRDQFEAAMPEGGELPLRAIAGFVGKDFDGEVLANEILAGSISMTTISFDSL